MEEDGEDGKIYIEDSFKFERSAMKVASLIFIGLIAIGGIYWIIIYPPLVKLLTVIIFPSVSFLIWYFMKRLRDSIVDCSFLLTNKGFEINGLKDKFAFLWEELEQIEVVQANITYRDSDSSDTIRYLLKCQDKLETHVVDLRDTHFHVEKIRDFLYHLRKLAKEKDIKLVN